ncbi:MAG: hypothetical protein AAGH40_12060 [Verrucomicrobiota bacterium]
MNPTEAKRLFLRLFIGFLSLTAAIAILSVLSGEFGEFQLKVLATTFSISAASICSMSCAVFIDKKNKKELGITGIVFSGIAASMIIGGLWTEINEEEYWKLTITFVVFAIALAHAFLLTLPDLSLKHKWSQVTACLFISILALQIVAAAWGEINSDGYYKFLAAISILVVLFTLVIPILMKIHSGIDEGQRILNLTENPDGTFSNNSGEIYTVTKVKAEPTGRG